MQYPHHAITFPFTRNFVPKGCRLPRDQRMLARGHVVVPRAGENEVEVAYRIAMPGCDPVRVLSFRRRLWWPLNFGYEFSIEEYHVDDLLERLDGDASALFDFLDPKRLDGWHLPKIDEVAFRSIGASDEDQVLARIQRTISQNILLVGDRAFGLGGQPVYLREAPVRKRKRRRPDLEGILVANAGSDRSANYIHGDFRNVAGNFGSDWVQERLRRGEFDLAGNGSFRSDLFDRSTPNIERLSAPPEPFDAETIRLDALFRQARNFAVCIPAPGWVYGLDKAQSATMERLMARMSLVEEGADDAAMSAERLDCLKAFLAFLKQETNRIRIRPYFDAIAEEIEQALPALRKFERNAEALAAEDDAALAALS